MNDEKLNQLFRAARHDTPPAAEPGFEHLVLTAIQEPPAGQAAEPGSLFDQLGLLLPRIAGMAAVLIALCLAADYGLSARAQTDLTDGLTALSEQWLFAAK